LPCVSKEGRGLPHYLGWQVPPQVHPTTDKTEFMFCLFFRSVSVFFFFAFLLSTCVLIALSIEGGGHFGGENPYFEWEPIPNWGSK
jgi:hypothetical protein